MAEAGRRDVDIGTVDGVKDVEVVWTFDPPWGPDRMTEEGRDMLQAMGF